MLKSNGIGTTNDKQINLKLGTLNCFLDSYVHTLVIRKFFYDSLKLLYTLCVLSLDLRSHYFIICNECSLLGSHPCPSTICIFCLHAISYSSVFLQNQPQQTLPSHLMIGLLYFLRSHVLQS